MATYRTPATCSRITTERAWAPVGRMSESPTLVRLVNEKNSRSKKRAVRCYTGSIEPGQMISTAT